MLLTSSGIFLADLLRNYHYLIFKPFWEIKLINIIAENHISGLYLASDSAYLYSS